MINKKLIKPSEMTKELLDSYKHVMDKFGFKEDLSVVYEGVQLCYCYGYGPDFDLYSIILKDGKKGTTFAVTK